MQRHVYRLIAMVLLFLAAMVVFTGKLKEMTFQAREVTSMSEATFPNIVIETKGVRVNPLFGYSVNLNSSAVRESLTPIDEEQNFYVLIDEHELNVKRLLFELWDPQGGSVLESGSVSALDPSGDYKRAKIKIKAELTDNKEYFLKMTAVTATGKKIRFYTRLKYIREDRFAENLEFVMNFHNALFDKSKAEQIRPYLESSPKADNSSFAYVNINSSLENVMWGELDAVEKTEAIPSITEDNANTTSVRMKYLVGVGNATYFVTEFYRVQWTSNAMYLLSYERHAEESFMPTNASLAKSELKLGIVGEDEPKIVTSAGNKQMCFVRERELWYYNIPENRAVCVFSFRNEYSEDSRNLYDQHNIRVLSMDDYGNIDFIVYGYMDRGVYEGKVAVVLYKYYSDEDRVEEQVYIPLETTYMMLKEDLDRLSYVNHDSLFYFSIFNTLYRYNIITKQFTVVMDDLSDDSYVVFDDKHIVVWQSSSDIIRSDRLEIMELETGDVRTIEAQSGYSIRLLGSIDDNVIYGMVKRSDISKGIDGKQIVPCEKLYISDLEGNVLKEYKRDGHYVTGISTKENIIELDCVSRQDEGYFISEEKDHILNYTEAAEPEVGINIRITEKMLTEKYIYLPEGNVLPDVPKWDRTVNTVITDDTTLRLSVTHDPPKRYYTYYFGDIGNTFVNASDAIVEANDRMGLVINEKNHIIWERGASARSALIGDFKALMAEDNEDSFYACLAMIMKKQYIDVEAKDLRHEGSDAVAILEDHLSGTAVNISGVTLTEMLYYVGKGCPVMALTGNNKYIMVIGYDEYGITWFDPVTGTRITKSRDNAESTFASQGNVFITYIQ